MLSVRMPGLSGRLWKAMPMRSTARTLGLVATLAVAACAAVPPSGPTILALPPEGKSFAVFQQEDALCQQTAAQQSNLASAPQVAGNSTVGGAGLGALGGAAVGALIGSVSGSAGAGAAIGAGTGLVGGGLLGASSGERGSFELQRRFDAVYAQCMASHGNRLQGPSPRPFAFAPTPGFPVAPVSSFSFGYGSGPRWGRPHGWGPGWGPGWGTGFGWRGGYW